MTNSNNGGAANDPDIAEALNKQNKERDFDKVRKLLTSFKEDVRGGEEGYKTEVFNHILGGNTNGDDEAELKKRLKKYAKTKPEEFMGLEDSVIDGNVNFDNFKTLFPDELREIKVRRSTLKKLFLNEFDGIGDYEADIFPKIEKKSQKELSELVNGDITKHKNGKEARQEFIRDSGISGVTLKKFDSFFSLNLKEQATKILNNTDISQKKKEEFIATLQVLDKRNKSMPIGGDTMVAIQEMFELHLLEEGFVRGVINENFSFVSLKDVVDKKLIKDNELNNIIRGETGWNDTTAVPNPLEKAREEGLLEIIQIDTENIEINKLLKNYSVDIAKNVAEYYNLDFNNAVDEYRNQLGTFKELKEKLNGLLSGGTAENFGGKINGLNAFGEGGIIEMVSVDPSGGKVINYVRVNKENNGEKGLILENIGYGNKDEKVINLGQHSEGSQRSYVEFFDFVKKSNGNITFTFYTEKDIEQKFVSGEIKSSGLVLYDKGKANSDVQARQQYINKYIEVKTKELEMKEKERSEKLAKGENIEEIDREIQEIGKIVRGETPINDIDDTIIKELNINSLSGKLDEIDEDGKGIKFEKGLHIECAIGESKNKEENALFEITGILKEGGKIELRQVGYGKYGKKEELSVTEFYEAFKERNAKRVKKINDFQSLFNDFQNVDGWGNYEFKDGKILKKKEGGGNSDEAKYLVSDKDDEVIKIESIDGNVVKIRYGKQEDKDVKKGKEKFSQKIVSLENRTYELSFTEFGQILKDKKKEFKPDSDFMKDKKEKGGENDIKRSLWTAFFNGYSIMDLISSGKMFINGIEEYLKKGNELRAAKLALSFGKFLPEELAAQMKIKVEAANSDSMENALSNLKKVDSSDATKMIRSWLLNGDAPDYKIEAGMLFMLESYGHLTAKGPLYDYRGKFLWYERLGGKIGDSLYMEEKENAKKSGVTFSEEKLVYLLIKEQSKKGERDSRLYKSVENKRKAGVKADFEKGYNDANGKRMASDILKGFYGELEGGTTSNAIGWLKKLVERGGSLEMMNEGFFVLLTSGAIFDVGEITFIELKNLWEANGMPIPMLAFSHDVSNMRLFNDTILELAKEMKKKNPAKYGVEKGESGKDIVGAAEDLVKNTSDENRRKVKEKDRIAAAKDFWKSRGGALSKSLSMSHTKDKETSDTDKIIVLKKEENPTLKRYYDRIRNYSENTDVFKEVFMSDAVGAAGLSGLNTQKIIKLYFSQNPNGFVNEKMANMMWEHISGDIDSVRDKNLTDEEKRRYLVSILRDVVAGLVGGSMFDSAIERLNTKGEVGKSFTKWGLDIRKFGTVRSVVENKENGDMETELEKVAENILRNSGSSTDFSNKIPNSVAELLRGRDNRAANDSIFRRAA